MLDPDDFRRQMREAREARGLTQEELAERTRLSTQTISRVETGAQPATPSFRRAVRAALSIPPPARAPFFQGPFGDWIADERERQDLTQQDLGAILKSKPSLAGKQVGPSTISQLESGNRPSVRITVALADWLQVPEEQRPAFRAWARPVDDEDADPASAPAPGRSADRRESASARQSALLEQFRVDLDARLRALEDIPDRVRSAVIASLDGLEERIRDVWAAAPADEAGSAAAEQAALTLMREWLAELSFSMESSLATQYRQLGALIEAQFLELLRTWGQEAERAYVRALRTRAQEEEQQRQAAVVAWRRRKFQQWVWVYLLLCFMFGAVTDALGRPVRADPLVIPAPSSASEDVVYSVVSMCINFVLLAGMVTFIIWGGVHCVRYGEVRLHSLQWAIGLVVGGGVAVILLGAWLATNPLPVPPGAWAPLGGAL